MSDNSCIRVFADVNQITQSKERLAQVDAALVPLANVLNLAGNEMRLKMLLLLFEEQNLCVCDIADVLNMKISAISQHLRKLKDGGLIRSEKVGQTVFYSFNVAHAPLFQQLFGTLPVVQPVG